MSRLNKEVTAAREALATLKPQASPMLAGAQMQAASQAAAMEQGGAGDSQEVTGITEEIVEKLQEKATVLTQERKKRGKTVPEGLATADSIKQFVAKSRFVANLSSIQTYNIYITIFSAATPASTRPLCPGSSPWTSAWPTRTRS